VPDDTTAYKLNGSLPVVGTNTAVLAAIGKPVVVVTPAGPMNAAALDFKLHELRHTAASLAIRSGANIKALQNMLGHASARLTLDRYGHLYQSDVDAVGQAIDAEITVTCGHGVGTGPAAARHLWAVSADDLQ
jgi:Phage integrase family